ncbi:hypothetical protein [Thermobrachium celere]|uniref:hypothetical protein n=1 Tax=Thermobrachium celere TaxID=53422 RepID=UPI001942BA74|nr:hypothetical protein [Thermobrachium celere]GFR34198.1 hypothetical protein TCEA9_00100 [Thermobrachium celere]
MKMLKLVCEYSKKYKFDISFYIFIVVITWSFAILNPILIGKYLDILINHKNINYIINFIELLFFIKFVEVITIYFKSIISARIKTFIAFDLNNFILEHVKKIAIKIF